jgi:hypothetical protein
MNTFGILPTQHIKNEVLKQMLRCAGPGGKVVIGCWYRGQMKLGFQEFYTPNANLCGVCKESDFDFEAGNFKCSTSDYFSHWWTQQELNDFIVACYPGLNTDLSISFKIIGIGIFAIVDIKSDATFVQEQ